MDKDKVKNFITSQRENGIPDDQIYAFLQEKGAIPKTPEPEKKPFVEKVADFTGGKEIAQGIGQAIASKATMKDINEVQQSQFDLQSAAVKRIKEMKERGEDTTKLQDALNTLVEDTKIFAEGSELLLNPNELTPKQVIGDGLQLGTTVAGVGSYSKAGLLGDKALTTGLQKAVPSAVKGVTEATSIGKGIIQGAKTGAVSGAAIGGATGVSQGLQDDKNAGEIIKQGVTSAIGGAVTGGIVGGVIGGVSGGLRGRALRTKVLEGRTAPSGIAPDGTPTAAKVAPDGTPIPQTITPEKAKAIEIAKTQGFDDSSIDFMNTMSQKDKVVAQKMITLAEDATKNKRALTRPIDVLGDNTSGLVSQVQKQNTEFGKLVDQTAKSLKGQAVDVAGLRTSVIQKLDDSGITIAENGKLDFSNSVYKNTPAIQKEITKVIKSIPNGNDAYQLHIFKKSVDELVDYGTGGEGLKGSSKNLLKAIRAYADDTLDSTFESYNQANTQYKFTRDFIEQAQEFAGKKVDLSSKEGAIAFGQKLRSVFSNNASRGNAMKFIEDTELMGKQLKLSGADQNLLDQAIFTEILEEVYGTQATTSLQGQVQRAVKGTQKVLAGIRNPIQGAGDLVATVAEKAAGISDENKKKILQALLN